MAMKSAVGHQCFFERSLPANVTPEVSATLLPFGRVCHQEVTRAHRYGYGSRR